MTTGPPNAAIYLDHNSTAPMLPEVADALREAALRYVANPSSQHRAGQAARKALEATRTRLAELLGARTTGLAADRLIFTSGGTEANNLALAGLLAGQPPGHVITSAIEHPAVLEPLAQLERQGWQVTRIEADQHGVVRLDQLAAAFRPETRLVSIMTANNETGVLQPLDEIAPLCRQHQVPLHTDASQTVGKLPTDFATGDLAALSCSAHKFHGPVGIGALLLRHDLPLGPQLWGGHQQAGLRPGTEPTHLALGMLAALEAWAAEADSRRERLAALQARFEQTLLAAIPTAVVQGQHAPRLPNTSNIAFPGVERQVFFMALDLAGVACSTGSACASGSSEPSPVLQAMGLKKELIGSALRFSWGARTEPSELDEACRRIVKAHNHLQR